MLGFLPTIGLFPLRSGQRRASPFPGVRTHNRGDTMEDVKRLKSKPELEATVRRRQSVTYPLDWMTDRLSEFSTFYKKFEEAANKMGYVSPRALREKRRKEKRKLMKELEDTLAKAIQMAILYRRSRGPKNEGSP